MPNDLDQIAAAAPKKGKDHRRADQASGSLELDAQGSGIRGAYRFASSTRTFSGVAIIGVQARRGPSALPAGSARRSCANLQRPAIN
jgi:hypothetical protein